MAAELGDIERLPLDRLCRATLSVATSGCGMVELTAAVADFLRQARAVDGIVSLFIRHTSASLTIQENADPDVQKDLLTALARLAPEDFGWRHASEGPDDMPAHVKAMLSDVSVIVPVKAGRMNLGTWQAIYLIEHRDRPHGRVVDLSFVGSAR